MVWIFDPLIKSAPEPYRVILKPEDYRVGDLIQVNDNHKEKRWKENLLWRIKKIDFKNEKISVSHVGTKLEYAQNKLYEDNSGYYEDLSFYYVMEFLKLFQEGDQ